MAAADVAIVKLASSEGKVFEVPRPIALKCLTIKNMLEDLGEDDDAPIPLPNVTNEVLQKVIDFCVHHENDPVLSEEEYNEWKGKDITGWDLEFVTVELKLLFEMILAANYLDVKGMLDVTCKCVAHKIKGKTPDEIKKVFGVEGDFTKEEEEQVRREHEWLQEKPIVDKS